MNIITESGNKVIHHSAKDIGKLLRKFRDVCDLSKATKNDDVSNGELLMGCFGYEARRGLVITTDLHPLQQTLSYKRRGKLLRKFHDHCMEYESFDPSKTTKKDDTAFGELFIRYVAFGFPAFGTM